MTDARDLEDVRYYLRAWRSWCLSWRPHLGYPQSCLSQLMAPAPAWDSEEDQTAEFDARLAEIGDYVLHRIDQCVDSLPRMQRSCVRFVYLRESCTLSSTEARRICGEAEKQLVPMLRAKNVLVGTTY